MSEDGLPQPIEFFIASDASAIVEHTKRVLYLEDDDIAHIAAGELHIHRLRRLLIHHSSLFDVFLSRPCNRLLQIVDRSDNLAYVQFHDRFLQPLLSVS